jgi:hypothetical protein
MTDEAKVPEPQDEKGDETANSDTNQPDDGTPASDDTAGDQGTPEVPEGFVPKDQYDDLEKRYNESSGEALVLREAARNSEQARRELTNEPTESELLAAFPEWEVMSESERRSARLAFQADRRSAQLLAEREDERAKARWNTDLELAIAKNPTLQGKEQAFKDYANMPTHRGVTLDVLVDAFLHKSGSTSNPSLTPKPALEGGNGGPRGPISSKKKYSAEEMQTIQASDPRKYREMLLAGDFDD